MFNEKDFDSILNATVYDRNGDKVGSVGQLYLDDETGSPSWLTVNTGLFGMSESFIPYDDSMTVADDRIDVPYDKDFIKDAPRVDADGHIDHAQERELYAYYEREYTDYHGRTDDVLRDGRDDEILVEDRDRVEGHDRYLDDVAREGFDDLGHDSLSTSAQPRLRRYDSGGPRV